MYSLLKACHSFAVLPKAEFLAETEMLAVTSFTNTFAINIWIIVSTMFIPLLPLNFTLLYWPKLILVVFFLPKHSNLRTQHINVFLANQQISPLKSCWIRQWFLHLNLLLNSLVWNKCCRPKYAVLALQHQPKGRKQVFAEVGQTTLNLLFWAAVGNSNLNFVGVMEWER